MIVYLVKYTRIIVFILLRDIKLTKNTEVKYFRPTECRHKKHQFSSVWKAHNFLRKLEIKPELSVSNFCCKVLVWTESQEPSWEENWVMGAWHVLYRTCTGFKLSRGGEVTTKKDNLLLLLNLLLLIIKSSSSSCSTTDRWAGASQCIQRAGILLGNVFVRGRLRIPNILLEASIR